MSRQFKKGSLKGPYNQKSIRERIEALFLDNVGKIVTRPQIIEVSKDPKTGKEPENWHQRLSELRTDHGYTILSWRDRKDLKVEEYLMPDKNKRPTANKRVRPTPSCWKQILKRAGNSCEWREDGQVCGLQEGDIDPIGGGTVKLTPDHNNPHSVNPTSDPGDPSQWKAFCGRHQVMKKNYWDSTTGKINISAILQSLPEKQKYEALEFLETYFGKNK
jgi:hypothetical protein